MTAYTQTAHSPQGFACVDENLILTELCPAREVFEFIASAPFAPDLIEAKWEIIDACESGALGAVEARKYLEAIGAFEDDTEFMRIYCAGARAYLGVPTPQPLPPAAPGGIPGARSAPSEYLLDVLAPARSGRAA